MGTGSATAPSTSSSLLERVKLHDADSWRRLSDLYGPVVYRWARRTDLQPSDAADVVQEVFAAVLTGVGGFRRGPQGGFRGWLWTITRNKIRDHFRDVTARGELPGGVEHAGRAPQVSESPPEERGPSSGSDRELLHRALRLVEGDFQRATWQAFWRTSVEGRPPADVAEELGLTLAAVYAAKSRVIRRLREELAGLTD